MSCAVRWRLRLAAVPPDELVDLVAELLAANPAAHPKADAIIARHETVPDWAVHGIFLSPDLLSPLLQTLTLADASAARVSTAWAPAWRRHLPHIAAIKPGRCVQLDPTFRPYHACELPDGDYLVSSGAAKLALYTPTWNISEPNRFASHTMSAASGMACDGATQRLFVRNVRAQRSCISVYNIATAAMIQERVVGTLLVGGPVFRSGRLLVTDEEAGKDSVMVLDATTLSLVRSFDSQRPMLKPAGLCLMEDDCMVVLDERGMAVYIFAPTWDGTLQRTIDVGFMPSELCLARGKLFVVENRDTLEVIQDEDEGMERFGFTRADAELWGRRVFVVDPEAAVAQQAAVQELLLHRAVDLGSISVGRDGTLRAMDFQKKMVHELTML